MKNNAVRNRLRRAGFVTVATLAFAGSAFATTEVEGVPTFSASMLDAAVKHTRDGADYSLEARKRVPWFVSIGAYFPNFTGDGTTNNVGSDLAFGYRFATDNADIRVSARGQIYGSSDSFGDNANIDISQFCIDAFYRMDAFYFGPGIGFGQISAQSGPFIQSGESQTVWALTVGYDFTTRMFVEARWQTAPFDFYKGYSVSVGYRF